MVPDINVLCTSVVVPIVSECNGRFAIAEQSCWRIDGLENFGEEAAKPDYESHLWDEFFCALTHWGPVNGTIAGKRRNWYPGSFSTLYPIFLASLVPLNY